jgi:hypothetical protein
LQGRFHELAPQSVIDDNYGGAIFNDVVTERKGGMIQSPHFDRKLLDNFTQFRFRPDLGWERRGSRVFQEHGYIDIPESFRLEE